MAGEDPKHDNLFFKLRALFLATFTISCTANSGYAILAGNLSYR